MNYDLKEISAVLIDDMDPIRKAIKRILISMGIEKIQECNDGEEAIRLLAKQPEIDLVLSDIYMRKTDGFEVLAYVRNRPIRSDIPFIIITGESSKEDIVKSNDLGSDDYIMKPFQSELLISKVKSVLNKYFQPTPQLAKIRDGDKHIIIKQYEKAYTLYKEALELDPESKRARYCMAISLMHSRKIPEAIELLNKNIALSASYYKNYAILADIYLEQNDSKNAVLALMRELEFNPKQPGRQSILANLLINKGNFIEGIDHFREALKQNMRHPEALAGIGKAYAASADLDKALYYFRRLRRYHPTDSIALECILETCIKAGEEKKAELALKDENNLHPKRFDSYIFLSKLYIATNRLEEASKTIERLFRIDRNNHEGLKIKAIIEMKRLSFASALESLQALVKISPDVDTKLAIAECCKNLKKLRQGVETCHDILSQNPGHTKTLHLLAEIFLESKQTTKAYILYNIVKDKGFYIKECQAKMKICHEHIKKKRVSLQKISS